MRPSAPPPAEPWLPAPTPTPAPAPAPRSPHLHALAAELPTTTTTTAADHPLAALAPDHLLYHPPPPFFPPPHDSLAPAPPPPLPLLSPPPAHGPVLPDPPTAPSSPTRPVSNAVHQAKVLARIKADNFAIARKREKATHRALAAAAAAQHQRPNRPAPALTAEQIKKNKYQNRLALNRESAAVSRLRRKEYVKLLEEQLINVEKERLRLAAELVDMCKQQHTLKEHLAQLESAI